MRLGMLALVALLAGGCTILLKPDRDAIVASDGGMDATIDATVDAGDAGWDAGSRDGGPDGGCMQIEVSCSDGLDNDCDGNSDCSDRDCANDDGYCCDVGEGAPWSGLPRTYNNWTSYPVGSDLVASATSIVFGTSTGQVVHPTCAPLAFGAHFETVFTISGNRPDHYASLVFAPVDMPRGGADMTLLADLTLRVPSSGMATLERAGTVLGITATALPIDTPLEAAVDLLPSVDESGRPVLLVSAAIQGQRLANREILMPLSDLIGSAAGCSPSGLFLAFEGRGSSVQVTDDTTASMLSCPSPTEFIADGAGPFGETPILTLGAWRDGGAGEPSLLASGSPTNQLDLLVDASERERSDEILRFVDYSIGGAVRVSTAWVERSPAGAPELFGAAPSSREPSLTTGFDPPSPPLVGYARQQPSPSRAFEIASATLNANVNLRPGDSSVLLAPGEGEITCTSLRDPALVALTPLDEGGELLVFFTCETTGGPPTIGVARLREEGLMGFVVQNVDLDILPSVGELGRQGVLSPEVAVTGEEGGTYALRIWFLARNAGGRVTVGLAFGSVEVGSLPRVALYPGNPILESEDPVLGGACPLGCTIDSLGVTPTEGMSMLWSPALPPSYIFLVERSRFRADGVDHELIPIRQPRPSGG